MTAEEYFKKTVKERMTEIGLTYTEEQACQMADFIHGIVRLTQEIQKDFIINKIKEMK